MLGPGVKPKDGEIWQLFLRVKAARAATFSVRWATVGTSWETDYFFSPLLRQPAASGPLLSFGESLLVSMVFPHEVALLQAFIETYDELGLDETGAVDPTFVDWITDDPTKYPTPNREAEGRVHRRLLELSRSWRTAHPCWLPSVMPLSAEGREWPTQAVEAVLGTHVNAVDRQGARG